MEAMGSVTVETVTARLVGMEINVNSSATSPPGKASENAHLQMAKSAVTEGPVCVANVLATMLIQLGTGETFTGTPVNVMKGTADLFMIDTLMTSAQVTASVTVEDATAKQAGTGRSVNTPVPARSLLRKASSSVRTAQPCRAREGADVNVESALATHQGTSGCTARPASVMTGAVRTWTGWCVEVTVRVLAVAVFVSEAGLASSASIRGNAT